MGFAASVSSASGFLMELCVSATPDHWQRDCSAPITIGAITDQLQQLTSAPYRHSYDSYCTNLMPLLFYRLLRLGLRLTIIGSLHWIVHLNSSLADSDPSWTS